ncbi:LapA family protein [Aminiphilus circumscriptus]|uniref:LapA family protein n=1 Tax=Aminiphilus circumscriptus TaxID=290732 RepID=UPI0004923D5B|nr:LapA family protein [Aminiphilus circumscriptus]
MKSYALAIAIAMLVAAGYAFQNTGDVTVRFLIWERQIPQGIWEILLFAAGGILMWFVSLVALLEVRSGLKREIRDLQKRNEALSEERTALLTALASLKGFEREHVATCVPAPSEEKVSTGIPASEECAAAGVPCEVKKWEEEPEMPEKPASFEDAAAEEQSLEDVVMKVDEEQERR